MNSFLVYLQLTVPIISDKEHINPLRIVNFSEENVARKIKSLKPSSAPGPDKISARFLQTFSNELSKPLAILFNKSFQTGELPEDWKIGNITPIFKKGAKSEPSNYRPISLTSTPCKIMESIIKDHLVQNLSTNNLMGKSQHGFIEHKSCVTNLLEFFEMVTKAYDQSTPFDVVYLDLAKAFDKVPHSKLIAKLGSYGIQGKVLDWITNWLTNRKQRVVLNGEHSKWAPVLSGVPQGSVLGPLLFIIFTDDIDSAAELISIINKFADDTKLGQAIHNEQDYDALQQCLNSICEWAKLWGMKFNTGKCRVVHTGRSNPRNVYYMDGTKLETSENERDLGIIISSTLKPTQQCAEAVQRANYVLGTITRAFHYRDRDVFINLYKQYVRPHIEYCAPAWSPWTAADINYIEQVQIRAVKMVSGLTGKNYAEKLAELGLQTVQNNQWI